MRRLPICLSLAAALAAIAQQKKVYQPIQEVLPGPPITQPIAYSHKVHIAAGLVCKNCHTMPGEGFQATYPKATLCMGCHASIKAESAEIQKLARFAKEKQTIPWERVYRVPDYVWFNHALHVQDAGIACGNCHGEVAQRDVLFKEKSTSMVACMDCHARNNAANGCDVCHASQ
ncbi:MAG: cytochrome c3 family protein [Bryobacteraceae bacterium]